MNRNKAGSPRQNSRQTLRKCHLWAILGLLWCGGLAAQQPPAPAETPSPASLTELPVSMESRPYRIRMLLGVEGGDWESLARELEPALARSVGNLWQAEFGPWDAGVKCDAATLSRWSINDAEAHWQADDIDFWFAVAVRREGARHFVAVRGWQPQFDWLSPVHESTFYEARETAGRAIKLSWELFRPTIVVEHVDKNDARVRIPAGDLQPADPAYQLFQPGDCLVPWMMYYTRDKVLQKRQELPWTYVRLDKINGPLAQATVLSGLRTPLGGKTRGRVEKVAVAARAVFPETTLQVGVQNAPARRLAGYRLELRPKLPEPVPPPDQDGEKKNAKNTENAEPPEPEEVEKLLTDRLGEARLPRRDDVPMQWVFIYSGELLLARVPFVAGSVPFSRLDVPDDSIRLRVEGDLQVLQNELINQVAERNVLMASARSASKKADWQRVETLKKSLDTLPDKKIYRDKLAAIQVQSVKDAKARKDRNGQVRIERLCRDVGELIDRYLDPEKLQQLKEELEMLRQDAKANADAK